jgi:hypothetical protein
MMRKRIELPPLAYQNYPVDIQLRISQKGAQYELRILSEWDEEPPFPIEMTAEDLRVLNEDLQQEIYSIARNNSQETPGIEELRALAECGYDAYKKIFDCSEARNTIDQLSSQSSKLTIQVVSKDFFLPWELIYPISPKDLDFRYFWGMNHLISRVIPRKKRRPGACVSPRIDINGAPILGLLTYRGLDGVVEGELNFFQELYAGGQITLRLLHSLDPQLRQEGIEEFRKFWKNSLDLAHLACHAVCNHESPNCSHILLSEEFQITLRDMNAYDMAISGYPLIVLNACGTGTLNPLHTSHFVAAFLKHGARGVVATECAVPDMFAADFAQKLYTDLFTGKQLGESLLAARRHFLTEHGNPSGLLYSLYANPSIQLVKAGGSDE